MPQSATAKHLPADERRAVTVLAVIKLASTQNPSDITTAAIASEMGLTQGALFRHFPTKDAILQAVMAWVAEHLLTRVDLAMQGAASPMVALEAMFMAHTGFVAEHPGVPPILFSELQRAGDTGTKRIVQTLLSDYGQRLRQIIDAGKAQGEFDSSLETEAAAILFLGTVQGLVMQSLLAGKVANIGQNAPRVFAIYRRGIRSTP